MSQSPDVSFDGLYGDAIMDHYRNPRHRDPLADADVESHELNPFCGDEVTLRLKLDGSGLVVGVSSQSQGCSIIQASASMMADAMPGKSLVELMELSRLFRDFMQGRMLPELSVSLSPDLEALQVVRQFPVRIKCALLPWTALEEGIQSLRHTP